MAKWMREFVAKHPQYKQDSVITDKINYDLFQKCDRIAKGEEQCPELIGNPVNKFKWESLFIQTHVKKDQMWGSERKQSSCKRMQTACVCVINTPASNVYVLYQIFMITKLF